MKKHWWIASFTDAPAGPSWRARCTACPWLGPIRRVPKHQLTADELEAGAHGYGLIAKAASAAHADLAEHRHKRHGYPRVPQLREGDARLCWTIKEAT